MGVCRLGLSGCLKPARGGNTCPDCLVDELVLSGVPRPQAMAYQSILAQIQKLYFEADELAAKISERCTSLTPSANRGNTPANRS